MRSCGYCKNLDTENGVCTKGYPIKKFEKLEGYSRPKNCTKKQDSAKKKRENSDKWLNKKLDEAWSKAVRLQGYCSYCGKRSPEVVLHAHHIFSRRHFSTRWDVENGVCLCTGCHLYIAHKDIQEFADWVLNRFGAECLERLRRKAHTPALFGKDDKRAILDDLEGIINKHSEQVVRGRYGF